MVASCQSDMVRAMSALPQKRTCAVEFEIAPGFKAGRHSHPGVVVAHVVEGDFWLHMDGQSEQVFHVGESVAFPDRGIHNEGATDKPVKLNVVYVVEKGKPLVSPAQ